MKTDYRYYFTIDGTDYRCYPFFEDEQVVKWEKYEDLFWRPQMSEIRFKDYDKDGIIDYTRITSQNIDEPIYFKIYSSCDDYTNAIFGGFFSRRNCKIDEDNCWLDVEVITDDDYTCFLKKWENEYNILNVDTWPAAGNVHDTFTGVVHQYLRRLNDVIQYILDEMDCGLTLNSDFFESATSPVTGFDNYYQYMVIGDKSDVVYAYRVAGTGGGFDPATELNISMKKLLNILTSMFDLRWYIDGSDFYIKHISEFTDSTGPYDLTTLQNPHTKREYALNKNKYEYLDLDLPDREEFSYQDQYDEGVDHEIGADYTKFYPYFIQYTDISEDAPKERLNIKKYDLTDVTPDYHYIRNNSDAVGTHGIFIQNTYTADGMVCLISENNIFGLLNWEYLIRIYHQYKRPYIYGIRGYIHKDSLYWNNETFHSKRRTKKQVEITFHACCDIFDNYRIRENLIKTYLGDGEVYSIEYNLSNGTLRVELLYETDDIERPAITTTSPPDTATPGPSATIVKPTTGPTSTPAPTKTLHPTE